MIGFFAAIGLTVATAFAGWRIWRRTRFFLHLLQLDGYKLHEYRAWIAANKRGLILRVSHLLAAFVLAMTVIIANATNAPFAAGLALVLWPVLFASSRRYRQQTTKKPLVFTERMRRLATAVALATLVVVALPTLVALAAGTALSGPTALLLYLGGLGLADFVAPATVHVGGTIMVPVEHRIQQGFKSAARARLAARPDLLIVAITGSYGKTSTKGAVAAVLGHRWSVLASPGSYNTPMGLCKVINDMLTEHHRVLVLEMGARYPGDIQELCDLAQPGVGIVTNVGLAHLETMGSIDGIAQEKRTLIENVPPDGVAILNADDQAVLAMRSHTRAGNILTVGMSENADIRAENVSFGIEGMAFDVVDSDGRRQRFETDVLGLHTVMNILFAVAVGHARGLRLREMAHAIRSMPSVEHRLKLRREGEILVLDDAFNSNPVGARNAVDILAQFGSGKRIVVTPGMVELGDRQSEENRAFGRHMADRIDVALLVGRTQTAPIREGLLEGGFSAERIHVFASLNEARDFLRTIQQPGDVVLYENDLPDHYEAAA